MKGSVDITLFFLFLITITSVGFSCACILGEREALLQFKDGLKDDSNQLKSWAANTTTDCCKWYGIVCSNRTGHVAEIHLGSVAAFGSEISSSLVDLKELRYLDLSNNNFGFNPIPSFLGSLKNLRFLNLSQSNFGEMIPHELGNLSNLKYLNLNGLATFVDSLDWLSSLSMLEFLDLSTANLSQSSNWLETINKLPSLVELHLSFCDLPPILPLANVNFQPSLLVLDLSKNRFRGPIPNQLQKFSSIKELDLSTNFFSSSIPDWLYNFQHLEILNLRKNLLEGRISSAIQNLTSLTSLDLSSNLEFDKGIPKSFKNLCNLRSLSFSRTKLGQEINEILDILSGCPSNVLESLNLHDCELSGNLSNQLSNFKNLTYLRLSNNSIFGPIPLVSAKMMSLRFLLLDNNKLEGVIPVWIGGLDKLENFNISYNLLEGKVSEVHFANLTKLRRLDGSMNKLKLEVGSSWIPPFLSLEVLRLRNWEIGAQFPNWLRSLPNLHVLDLSSSTISSTIPTWFWKSSSQFSHLNISQNQIRGAIPDIPNISLPLSEIDLSSNRFEGPLPVISPYVRVFDASNNLFSSSISNFLCYGTGEEKKTQILNLDNNVLTGEMSNCWSSWASLQLIRLSSNNLSGNIPESIGTLSGLMYLHLRNNSLSGELPLSLGDCELLVTLDLGENQLSGRILTWLGFSFDYLSILSLRGNKFYGEIPRILCSLTSLQILDLAHNNLSGIIPDCINSFQFMAKTDSQAPEFFYYFGDGHIQWDESILLMKGKIVEYDTILKYVKLMDLSSNNLSGEIPKEITQLKALQSLNLSNNFLSGNIPNDIGAMRRLEVLDLSRNQLNGRIPQSMTSMTFLSMLNVSYNKLSGIIPKSTQLQSFPASSFIGNKGLLGPPLIENSTTNGRVPFSPTSGEDGNGDQGEDGVNWGLYVSIAIGFIVGFWSILCPLIINRRWRHAYYLYINHMWNKIWWNLYLVKRWLMMKIKCG